MRRLPESLRECIAVAFREERVARGLDQKAAGDIVGVSQSTISRYETGEVSVAFEDVLDLARDPEAFVRRVLQLQTELPKPKEKAHERAR